MADLLRASTDILWVAALLLLISISLSYLLGRRVARHRLEVEYEYGQRKKLRDLIGSYHGRLLTAANSMNYRFWNFYKNPDRGWLDVGGDYQAPGYYFVSFVHRFLSVCSLIRQFEAEAMYIDSRIASKTDFIFMNYLGAIRWALTDVSLFEGLSYDPFFEKDHFFSDSFRSYCEIGVEKGQFFSFQAFKHWIAVNRDLDSVLRFFDGLERAEDRLRMDRLVVYHVLLIAFINTFGYKTQYTPEEMLPNVLIQVRNPQVVDNLVAWLPRHGLGTDREARRILRTWSRLKKLPSEGGGQRIS
ncbi:MAG: hypothetical protein A2Z21_05025 [Candidatus Fraserbacteria bacterium RBG_16_55_9]|uniref:Uncharacterized protein n=1 Tax=Fraserbacteria sp. (strain RBG_16_55_9) TaxID=1817864 RepID=A0A1F5V0Y1_FRAXR|nr:MAG: hypothetical protein A2Z21_05025 [Candidatus Fraserbacteria bacterium RBG_16_55_9]